MKRILFSLVAVGVLFSGIRAEACSCLPPPAPKIALEKAGAVFLGVVTKLELVQDPSSWPKVKATLAVNRTWKGVTTKTVEVTTSRGGASCGFGFQLGQEYLVYAYTAKTGEWTTSLCTRTRSKYHAQTEDLPELGEGEIPTL